MSISHIKPKVATQIAEPPIAKFLFADTRMAWLWLIIRLYVGYEWLTAGLDKLTGYSFSLDSTFGTKTGSSWIFTSHTGAAIVGFAKGGLAQASGAHPAVQSWYAWFLQNVVIPNAGVFAYLITFGEVLVGVALIFGLLTGIAAFFGAFMNMNYLLAGTVSTNPILGFLALFLVLAWRIAGYWGLDRYILPLIGTPWTGSLARKPAPQKPTPVPAAH